MHKTKRLRARAIILQNEKLVSMYREMDGRVFYTFPGGGMEGNESEQECVIREVYEEFGINVKPIKKVYTYENEISIEYFYICDWLDDKFGTGQGEEYGKEKNNGVYQPTLVNIQDIPNIPLMPPEVAHEFYTDYVNNGKYLRDDIKLLHATNINRTK